MCTVSQSKGMQAMTSVRDEDLALMDARLGGNALSPAVRRQGREAAPWLQTLRPAAGTKLRAAGAAEIAVRCSSHCMLLHPARPIRDTCYALCILRHDVHCRQTQLLRRLPHTERCARFRAPAAGTLQAAGRPTAAAALSPVRDGGRTAVRVHGGRRQVRAAPPGTGAAHTSAAAAPADMHATGVAEA